MKEAKETLTPGTPGLARHCGEHTVCLPRTTRQQGSDRAGQKQRSNSTRAECLRSPFRAHTKLPGKKVASPEIKAC